jgi:small subunit ribosomal protein S4
MYNLLEKKFRNYYEQAASSKGVTGTQLLVGLESRLDNVAYRLGFASSRRQARTMVSHGLFLINGKPVNAPSYSVSAGDIVEVREKSKKVTTIKASMDAAQGRLVPEWLTLDKENVKGTVNALPTREQLTQSINEQLIVELYSR